MGGLMRRRELLKVPSAGPAPMPTVLFEISEPLTVTSNYDGQSYGYTFDFADIFGKDFTITFSLTQGSSAGNVSSPWLLGGYRNNSSLLFAKWGGGTYRYCADSWSNIETAITQGAGISAKFVFVGRFSNKSATSYTMLNGVTDVRNNSTFFNNTTSAGTQNITFGKYNWAGTIHDFTIYDGELTEQQIMDYLGA